MKKCIIYGLTILSLLGCSSKKILSNNISTSSINDSIPPISLEEPKDNEVDVIVLAGQSNMEGNSWVDKLYANTNSSMHDLYRNGFDNTLMAYYCNNGANKSDEFVPVKAGQGYGIGSFGPEIGIAEELYNREYDKPVYLIKYALGGTHLYSQWNVNNESSLYYYMVDYIYSQLATLEEQDLKPVIRGFFWMQGEADSCWKEGSDLYYNNLSNLVSTFRDEFENYYGDVEKGIAFVDAGISDCESWVFYETVNSAKKKFSNSNPNKNYYIDTIENGLEYKYDNTDYYHFDATSEVKLGKLFISQLLDNDWM